MVNGVQYGRGTLSGATIRRDNDGLPRPILSHDCRVGGVRTGDRESNVRDRRDQACVQRTIHRSKVRVAAKNSAAQRINVLCERYDQKKHADNLDRGSAIIPRSDGFDSEDDEIGPISLDRSKRHIDQIVSTAKCAGPR